MRARSSYESSISDKFKVHAPSLVSHVGRSAPIGFSLIRGHGTGEFTKPTQAQDAYAISIFLQPSPKLAMKVNGRVLAPQSVAAGGVIISHLETVPGVRFNGPFDFVRCYVTKETLDELAEPARTPPLDGLRRPDFGTKDLVLYHLAVSAAPLIERGDPTDQLVLDQIALAVCSRLTLAYAGAPRDPRGLGRGRGDWRLGRKGAPRTSSKPTLAGPSVWRRSPRNVASRPAISHAPSATTPAVPPTGGLPNGGSSRPSWRLPPIMRNCRRSPAASGSPTPAISPGCSPALPD